ncbi:MAG: hypothetical protein C4294_17030 [Nitrospiraceae bacterium]
MESPAVQQELDFALVHNKRIIPVLLQEANVVKQLGQIQWIDFRMSFERGMRELIAVLKDDKTILETRGTHIPPRTTSYWGFSLVGLTASPKSVRFIATAQLVSLGLKYANAPTVSPSTIIFLKQTGLSDLGAAISAVANDPMAIFSMLYIIYILVHFVAIYLSVLRKVTFLEITGLQAVWPIFLIFSSSVNSIYSGFAMIDLLTLGGMLFSKGYRRWMVAYPSSWGAKN